jgi:uncharacterized SAM-binding protein YcdF (DUF218 family)
MRESILKLYKKFKKIIIILLLVCIIVFATIGSFILYYAKTASPVKSDVMIVLGCQIWDQSPSLSLEYRLQKALELYNAGYAGHIIVSGGQGGNEKVTEASVMKNWLVANGVDKSLVLEEGKSTSTYENLTFSKEIMDRQHFQTAVLVSNDFHMFRSLRYAKKVGIQASGGPAPNVWYLSFYSYCREVLSVIKNFVLYG